MKPPTISRHCAALAVAASLALSAGLSAQTVTTTTKQVTSEGTISSFEPHDFIIRSEAAPGPLTYSYTTSTRYVDDSGAVITRETIHPGTPVTVYYTRDGDRLLADRVIVHKTTTVPVAPATETTTTRTTTTTERPMTRKEAKEERKHEKEMREHPEREERREERREEKGEVPVPPVQNVTTDSVTTTDGTISTLAPDEFAVRTTTTENPVTYRYSKTTQYVDDLGNPVSVDVVRSGVPVTVHYIREDGGLVARRVIVHRAGPPGAPPRPLPPP